MISVAGTVTGSMSSPPLESIVLFTAYTITSDYTSDGLCIATTGSPIPLSPEVSIAKPADANSTAFESSITSLFHDYLGFASCSGNDNLIQIATNLVQVLNTTPNAQSTISADPLLSTTLVSSASNITSSSAATSSATENISSRFTTRDKAATGIVVPVVAIISLVLGILFYLRRRRKRSNSGEDTHGSEEETQPYLQQKAELDAEEKRRLELETVEVRYELDGRDCRNEMPAQGSEVGNEIDTIERPVMSSLKERHELKGEECSKELEAP